MTAKNKTPVRPHSSQSVHSTPHQSDKPDPTEAFFSSLPHLTDENGAVLTKNTNDSIVSAEQVVSEQPQPESISPKYVKPPNRKVSLRKLSLQSIDSSPIYEYFEEDINKLTIEELEEHTVALQERMEDEVRQMQKVMHDQVEETKSAQATTKVYAEKYLKLREDYELHVQRLMLKLTQEQQARTIVEDQLDNATVRLFRDVLIGCDHLDTD